MKYFAIVLVLVVAVAVAQDSQAGRRCRRLRARCSDSKQCCTGYCRDQRCIRWGEIEDERNLTYPCAYTTCSVGAQCVIDQVNCVQAPCPGQVACR